jgi:methylmalonyl-CoA/ethylmalonyl-CoA epimerase
MFKKIDHIAILVRDTEKALSLYRDQLELPVLANEELQEVGVRLTHLGTENVFIEPEGTQGILFELTSLPNRHV